MYELLSSGSLDSLAVPNSAQSLGACCLVRAPTQARRLPVERRGKLNRCLGSVELESRKFHTPAKECPSQRAPHPRAGEDPRILRYLRKEG